MYGWQQSTVEDTSLTHSTVSPGGLTAVVSVFSPVNEVSNTQLMEALGAFRDLLEEQAWKKW